MTLFSISLLAACSGGGATSTGDAGGTGTDTGTGSNTGTGTGTGTGSALGCAASEKPPVDQTLPVTSNGQERSVVVHIPPEYDPSKPTPLVLAYAFEGGTPSSMNQATGLTAAADAAGVVIAYPVGVSASYNAGKCCGKAWEEGVDDVQFTRDVLAVLEGALCVDAERIYATGMSAGAMMSYRLGCELSDRLAGVAAVGGALHMAEPCAPSRAVPLLAIHGTADVSVPYEGGQGQPPLVVTGDMMFGSVADSMAPFLAANGCSDLSEQTHQQGDATCAAFTGCEAGATVERCDIDGGGHTWPSGALPAVFGPTSTDLNASEKIMAFFAAHPAK